MLLLVFPMTYKYLPEGSTAMSLVPVPNPIVAPAVNTPVFGSTVYAEILFEPKLGT